VSDVVEACIARARERFGPVVFPEGHDERIIAAARKLSDQRIAQPVVLGTSSEIAVALARAGVSIDGIVTRDPAQSDDVLHYAALYREGRPDTNPRIAERLVRKPLFHAGMMVKAGNANAMIAGVANPTGRVIEAGLMTVGLAPGIRTPSSFFLMMPPQPQASRRAPSSMRIARSTSILMPKRWPILRSLPRKPVVRCCG
jgi:phosphate acetyltransferase